jgi:hypothetical protein
MSTYSQLPGALDIKLITGDEINVAISLSRNVTGYQFQSVVYVSQVLGGGGAGIISTVGATAATPSIYVANASTGALVWSLTETQTQSLNPAYTYRWYLRWITPGSEMTRTILAGLVVAKAPGT